MEGSTMTATLYDTLGVPADADVDELKAAWRRVAKATHPDTGGSEAAFQAAESAYATLSDPWLRSEYDRSLVQPAPEPGPDEQWVAEPAPSGWDDSLDDMPEDWLHVHSLRRRILANVVAALMAVIGVVVTLHSVGQWAATHQQGGVAVALEALGRLGIGAVTTLAFATGARLWIRRRGERW